MKDELIGPAAAMAAAILARGTPSSDFPLKDQVKMAFVAAYRGLQAANAQIQKEDQEIAMANNHRARNPENPPAA